MSVTTDKPGSASKRKSVAQIMGMTSVTPQVIAYAAIQVSAIDVSYLAQVILGEIFVSGTFHAK